MRLLETIVLALVQGLTEFLPISSTAHLILVPWLAGWRDPGLAFDVALHAGTLVAVLAYFARDWVTLLRDAWVSFAHKLWSHYAHTSKMMSMPFPNPPTLPREVQVHSDLLQAIVLATIPAALAGFFLESYAASVFRSPVLIAGALIAVSLPMWAADRRRTLVRSMESVGFADALTIGAAQAVAIIPGTSRSGITIAAGMFRNLRRDSAARFSFMLSTPIIGGATLLEGMRLAQSGLPAGTTMSDFLVGFMVSAVSGYAAIAFLLRYLQVRTLKIFVAYRMVLGIIILVVEFLRSSA